MHTLIAARMLDAVVRLCRFSRGTGAISIAAVEGDKKSAATLLLFRNANKYTTWIRPSTLISAEVGWRSCGWQLNQSTAHEGWRLFEDRRRKPPWMDILASWREAELHGAVSKRLPLTLAVTYVRSYEGLCDVLLSTTSGPRPARVQGLWDKSFFLLFFCKMCSDGLGSHPRRTSSDISHYLREWRNLVPEWRKRTSCW